MPVFSAIVSIGSPSAFRKRIFALDFDDSLINPLHDKFGEMNILSLQDMNPDDRKLNVLTE